MKKWTLIWVGVAIVVLITVAVFATREKESVQERLNVPEEPATAESPATTVTPPATVQEKAPEEKEQKLTSPQPTPLPVKKDSNAVVDSSVIRVSAEKLFSDFQENSVAARLKYDGKILEVTGKIAKIGNDPLGDYVRLIGDEAMAGYGGLHFYGVNKEKEKVALLKKGQTVTIRGKLSLGLKLFSFIIPLRIDSIIE